jgi:hypothetical protein
MEDLMKRLMVLVVLLAMVMTSGIVHASAQSSSGSVATPEGMVYPDASECTAEPATIDHLKGLFDTAKTMVPATPATATNATQPTPPSGQPADAQTISEINATWRVFVACVNSGDQLRTFSFLSDNKIIGDFTQDVANGLTDVNDLVAYFSATPVPMEGDSRLPYVPNQDLRVLSDGRVAWVTTDEVLIWIKVDNRWLIDEQYDLPATGTPTP